MQQREALMQQVQAIVPGTGATGGGGASTSVSIVPGSSSLTDTSFSPNPVQVSVGDTITWTNDDSRATYSSFRGQRTARWQV